jgi:choline dehydrogenase-like flavoprotein
MGCPFDAKRSVDRTYLPDALRAGAELYADCRAETIELRTRMKRVHGTVLDRETRAGRVPFTVDAPVVVVAAGAIHTPVILLRSGLKDQGGQIGRNLTFHLTTAVLGVYDRVIYAAGGRPQSAFCDEFLNKNGDEGGFWIESVPVHPALAAMSLPGFGRGHRAMMERFPRLGATISLVKEIDSQGSVGVNEEGRPRIAYDLGPKDLGYLKESIAAMCRLQFAAGAKSVMTLHARRTAFSSPEEIDNGLRNCSWGKNEIALFTAHPLGSCRMGEDPGTSVVDSRCQLHGTKGVFVLDGSVTPTSLGVNPQMTILAIAEKNGEWIAEHFRSLA